ncbi:phosphate propanoyltransferase [Phosphitispora sp. TUW77]|uniref:phosphate propanoyltransferase n=1 Tax=Phosphitispora sp. TUW77 TaxID=3152361 RepID=UPI003AB7EE5B
MTMDFFILDKPAVSLEDAKPHVEPLESSDDNQIKARISGRHIHVSQKDLILLYGPGCKLTKYRNLGQPGQYAAKETLTVVGPKGVIEGVRILGPVRDKTQVEVSGTDGYHLGIEPPVRDSGNIEGTPGIVLVGPHGAVTLKEGVILAATHIHMNNNDASKLHLKNGDRVQVLVDGKRDIIFTDVLIRTDENSVTEMHVDTDEANAAVIEDGDYVTIIGKILVS